MKRLFLTLAVAGFSLTTHPQGTVVFANLGQGVNAQVYESDGVTVISGPQFMAELFAGPSANSLASIAMTGFLPGSGNLAGYFYGGVQTINTVGPGAIAWVQVDVWNTTSGTSFPQAQASGLPNSWWQSAIFSVQTGREGVNPTLPGPLAGLGTSPVYLNSVPEPSALGLAAMSAAVLFTTRRARL